MHYAQKFTFKDHLGSKTIKKRGKQTKNGDLKKKKNYDALLKPFIGWLSLTYITPRKPLEPETNMFFYVFQKRSTSVINIGNFGKKCSLLNVDAPSLTLYGKFAQQNTYWVFQLVAERSEAENSGKNWVFSGQNTLWAPARRFFRPTLFMASGPKMPLLLPTDRAHSKYFSTSSK